MAPPRRRAETLALALAAAMLGACGPPDAQSVLDAYFAALKSGHVARAYALTTAEYRAHHDLAAFALAAARQPIFDRAERAGPPTDETVVELGSGPTSVRLVATGRLGALRLVDDPRDYYPRATPDQALASFARAVALGRADRAWSLIAMSLRGSRDPRAPLTPHMVELGARIEHALAAPRPAPIVIEGGSARLLLGDGFSILLELAPSGWELTSLE